MNATVENLAPCKKLLRVELDRAEVDGVFAEVEKDFQKQASLPGFRPGKAPRDMILKRYEKDIEEEVKQKLISQGYRNAIKEQKLDVVTTSDVEEIQFARGEPFQFAVTVETAPEFELPEYRGLPAKRETGSVTEADVERALLLLRERQANFETADREATERDVVVVNYTGTVGGQPITEIAPTAKGLTQQNNFWIEVKPDAFIPGFSEQLKGAKAGDKRTVTVEFPADFVTGQLAGKQGVYEVEIVEVKQKKVPGLDDALAKVYGAEDLDRLREGVRRDLQNELNQKQARQVRAQVTKTLLDQVQCELPESLVTQETRNVVYELVQQNQQRGVPKEVIDQQKEEIYKMANTTAKTRLKASFVFRRIAEKEGISVNQEEFSSRIYALSQSYEMTPEKFLKELEKGNGKAEIVAQLLNEKVIDFLQQRAKIEDTEPANPAG